MVVVVVVVVHAGSSSWRQETAVPKETTSTTLQRHSLRLCSTRPLSPSADCRTKKELSIVCCFVFSWHLVVLFHPLAIMADAPVDVLLKGSSGKSTRGLLRIIILGTIAAAAVSSRLFSVIRMFEGPSFWIGSCPASIDLLIVFVSIRIRKYHSRMYACPQSVSLYQLPRNPMFEQKATEMLMTRFGLV